MSWVGGGRWPLDGWLVELVKLVEGEKLDVLIRLIFL